MKVSALNILASIQMNIQSYCIKCLLFEFVNEIFIRKNQSIKSRSDSINIHLVQKKFPCNMVKGAPKTLK